MSEPPDDHDLLRQYLALRNEACPRCGYNLRQLTGNTCPECGDELRLKVGLVEPKLGAYLTALVSTAVGFGGSGFLTVLATIQLLNSYNLFRDRWVCAIPIMAVLCLIFGLILIRRRWFTAKPIQTQWAIAGSVFVLVFLAYASLLYFMVLS